MSVVWVIIGVVVLALIVLFIRAIVNDSEKWEKADEGIFDHAAYGRTFTVIHFDDGRTRLLGNWRISMIHPKGTRIRIMRNGLGEYRIEKI